MQRQTGQDMTDVLKKFKSIFEGLDIARGETRKTGEVSAKGKSITRSKTITEPPTDKMWEDHLKGTDPALGIIPIRRDNTCIWGCIDWDVYPLDHKEIVQDLKKKKIPLTVFRSKSGGAHLFLFTKKPVPAVMMRDKLKTYASAIGHARAEIFPKQEKINIDRGDVGSFLNLPYHNLENTVRYAFNNNGEPILNVEKFFEHYEKNVLSVDQFNNLKLKETEEDDFLEMPPCLVTLLSEGVGEGMRNETMYNVGVYLKKRFSEDDLWKKKMNHYNIKYFKPPINASELVKTQESLDNKDYFYKCKDEPLSSFCNSKLCVTKKYGVGDDDAPVQTISAIRKYNSDPPLFFCDIDGQTVMVETAVLHEPDKFSMACLEQINRPQMPMSKIIWRKMLIKLLQEKQETDLKATEDLKIDNQLKEYMEDFVNKVRGKDINDIQRGVAYSDDNYSYFKMKDFWKHLVKNKWPDKRYPKHVVVQKLQTQLKIEEDYPKINGKTVRCFKMLKIVSVEPEKAKYESQEPSWKRKIEQ